MKPAVRRASPRASAIRDALVVLPILVTAMLMRMYLARHILGVDFEHTYWPTGERILDGGDPYAWSHSQMVAAEVFVYPALAALVFAPFALVAKGPSDAIFIALSIAAVPATLRLLSVRDWRVYAVALLWWPVVNGWQTANLTLLLAFGLALIWRLRDRPILTGVVVAIVISLKPFMWPVVFWLLVTRRFRAAAWSLAIALALNALAWAVVGFGMIGRFVRLSGRETHILYRTGYGVIALAAHLGASLGAGTVVLVIASVGVAVTCLIAGRHHRDQEALALTVALILVASPLVWNHYFALLIVPLAVTRPRLSVVWVAPLLLWLCPATGVELWQIVLAWAVTASVVWSLCTDADLLPGAVRRGPALNAGVRQ